MGFGVGMKIEGLAELSNQLSSLDIDIHDKALRSGIRTVANMAAKEARSVLQPNKGVRFGALKEATTYKMLKRRGDSSAALVGVEDSARTSPNGKKINPGKYAHLIELGHVGRDGGHVAAIPFLSVGVDRVRPKARMVIEGRLNDWLKKVK